MTKLHDLFLWAVSHREELGFLHSKQKIQKLQDYHLSSVSMKFGEKEVPGNSIGKDHVISSGIAIAESLERVAMYSHKIKHSNGLAAHFDIEIAKENARRELLERDAFLWALHWKQKLPKILNENEAHFFELPLRDSSLKGVLCISNDKKPVYTLAVNSTLEEAIHKTYLDSVTFSEYVQKSDLPSMTPQEFDRTEERSILHHAQLAFSSEYQNALSSWPLQGEEKRSRPALKDLFTYRELELPSPFKSSGIHVIQAHHPELLNFYVGPVRELTVQTAYSTLAKEFGAAVFLMPHPFN